MTWKELVVIFIVLIVLGIAGLYFGGNVVKSTGGDMVNATHESVLLGWAGVPIGSFLMDTGTSWIKTAESITMMILALFFVGSLIWYYANKP